MARSGASQPTADADVAPDWVPPQTQHDITPAGLSDRARLRYNMEALRTLRELQRTGRAATPAEQAVLARWTSWGALPSVFDPRVSSMAAARDELRRLLSQSEYAAAERTVINAHYTNVAFTRAIWSAMTSLGVDAGHVLEPGCGAGNFIGTSPHPGRIRMLGVELDPVSAAIAGFLYPSATIRVESFADSPFPEGSFDAVVGNVPFGSVILHDPKHNTGRHSIHNHFLIKSLHLVKPGGIVTALTSRYTLDAKSETARREMYAMADLVGAIRLPTGAHQPTAGTETVTDLVILRRRLPGQQPQVDPDTGGEPSWLRSAPWTIDALDEETSVNELFHARPDLVLGQMSVGTGMYGSANLNVIGPVTTDDVVRALSERLDDLVNAGRSRGLTYAATPTESEAPGDVIPPNTQTSRPDGSFTVGADGAIFVEVAGQTQRADVPKAHGAELRALIGLRDAVTDLLGAEAATTESTSDLDARRGLLNRRYEQYVARYGPLGRFTLARTGRTDSDGSPVMRRLFPGAIRTFRADPFAPTVMALETFDPLSQSATKADIFTTRVVAPRQPRDRADTPEDALAISLDTTGGVDMTLIKDLLSHTWNVVDEVDAEKALGDLVFYDPALGKAVTAAEYLSGNVRIKLAHAEAAVASGQDHLERNVAALRPVIPHDLLPEEIAVALGAVWIPPGDVAAFLQQTLHDRGLQVEHFGGSNWEVRGSRHSVEAVNTWGTSRMDAITLAQRMMRQQKIVVTDPVRDADGRETRVINPVETEAASAKAAELAEAFGRWAWSDPERATRLARIYNDAFNAVVLRRYDVEHMTLPGLALTFTPRPHQLAAVARMVAEPSVGLFHDVGAGKTAEMVMGVVELKRLGMVTKPAIVVPNHMLEQFSREFLQLYPQARILAASSEDLSAAKRRQFVARVATGDWDAVILTRTAFEAQPVSREAQERYMRDELGSLRTQLDRALAAGSGSASVKRMQTQLANGEERLKARLAHRRDAGVTFDQTGIDYLCIDELHDYKNLTVVSNIEGVARLGSQRATDLDMKIHLLRDIHGDRVITGATATPIANSIAEAYVMQKYLSPTSLTDAGLTDFDAWAATFGQTVTEVELAPEGAGNYRTATRFAKFQNVADMLRLWHQVADVQTADDLALPTPALRARGDGHRAPESVVIAPTADLTAYVHQLGERATAVRARQVQPTQDNMLRISTHGRMAALDMRLVGHQPASVLTDVPTKLDVAAARIHRIWEDHRDAEYLADNGRPHPARGALQIVFCDISTPSASWNAYDHLRGLLAGHGMDPSRVRFIHEAAKDTQKAELFAACRDGRVDVIIGSTQRMGVGTNIQRRAVALHHLDAPWRPADIAQREGRILRQGNQNDEVGIYRYVVERSFDAYMWQTLERKAKFIGQVMRGSLDVREIDDIGDPALSFNEVKALASGDPLILERADAEATLTRLQRLERAHHRNHSALGSTIAGTERHNQHLKETVMPSLRAAIERRIDTTGAAFAATLANGHRLTDRNAAAAALRSAIADAAANLSLTRPAISIPAIVTVGGHELDLRIARTLGALQIELGTADEQHIIQVGATETDLRSDGHGLITRIENRIHTLDDRLEAAGRQVIENEQTIAKARQQQAVPFPHTDTLNAARQRFERIVATMAIPLRDRPARPPAEQLADASTTPGSSQATLDRGSRSAGGHADRRRPPAAGNDQHRGPRVGP